MVIDTGYLEEKLKLFTSKYTELNKIIEDNVTLSRKLEGAIETIQVLLKDIQVNTEPNVNKT